MDTPTANLSIRRVPLDSLHLDQANARQHGERNLDSIRSSLQRFGQAEPLVVHKGTGRVIGGNGRLVAMQALGWRECDIVEVDVDEVTATALGIALNRTGELAEWDVRALGSLLEGLQGEDALEGVGFDESEIDEILAGLEAEVGDVAGVEQDAVPDPPDKATTRPGDLWVLGRHRLLCGDSAVWEDVERMLGGEPVHLLNTDPPYNVKVEPRSNNAIAAGLSSFGPSHHQKLGLARHPEKAKPTGKMRPKDRPLQNDFIPDDEFARLLRAWFGNAARALLPGRGFYVWGGYANCANYPSALSESGLYFSQSIIWVKEHPVLTRKDFMGNHEWAFYGWREGAAHVWCGPTNATDVWSVKKLNHTATVHLTEKPVQLAARAMQYSSRRGENVLDLFGGSGSTMAAAERLNRHAFLMEIDPPYCDVIVERVQRLTGEDAVLEGAGQTFSQVAEERRGTEGGRLDMVRRIPPGAYEDYLAMAAERSYQTLADRYGVSKTAIVKRAKKEQWQDRIAELERQARERAEEEAVDELEAVRQRHLKEARFLQARAIQALKDQPPERGIRAASALNIAWKHELLLLGEPTERQASVEELIKRETRDLLVVVDDGECADHGGERVSGG